MSSQQIAQICRELGLHGMAIAHEAQEVNPVMQALPYVDRMIRLLEREKYSREDKRVKRLIKAAKFKVQAAVEDIDYQSGRGLNRQVMEHLVSCEWITRKQHAIFTGLAGVGKTWIGCAIGMQACRQLTPVLYFRLSRLLDAIDVARGDGSLPRFRAKLARTPLLILDDWGLNPLTTKSRHDLLELIDDRCGDNSVLITSQLPVSKWYDWVAEPTIADALLDRLVHHAHKIELKGESMRKRKGN